MDEEDKKFILETAGEFVGEDDKLDLDEFKALLVALEP